MADLINVCVCVISTFNLSNYRPYSANRTNLKQLTNTFCDIAPECDTFTTVPPRVVPLRRCSRS
jgi:hypothetical protein